MGKIAVAHRCAGRSDERITPGWALSQFQSEGPEGAISAIVELRQEGGPGNGESLIVVADERLLGAVGQTVGAGIKHRVVGIQVNGSMEVIASALAQQPRLSARLVHTFGAFRRQPNEVAFTPDGSILGVSSRAREKPLVAELASS